MNITYYDYDIVVTSKLLILLWKHLIVEQNVTAIGHICTGWDIKLPEKMRNIFDNHDALAHYCDILRT